MLDDETMLRIVENLWQSIDHKNRNLLVRVAIWIVGIMVACVFWFLSGYQAGKNG